MYVKLVNVFVQNEQNKTVEWLPLLIRAQFAVKFYKQCCVKKCWWKKIFEPISKIQFAYVKRKSNNSWFSITLFNTRLHSFFYLHYKTSDQKDAFSFTFSITQTTSSNYSSYTFSNRFIRWISTKLRWKISLPVFHVMSFR